MQGCKEPSFFFTKKNPAPAGEVEETMVPVASNSARYCTVGGKLLTFGNGQGIKSTTRRHTTQDQVNAAVMNTARKDTTGIAEIRHLT